MRASRPRARRGWGILETPVPGDVMSCLNELGVEIHRVIGEEAQGKCPAHKARTGKDDRHPSWSVNVEEGFHNCFSCGFRGPFVTLVEWMLGSNREVAVEWTRERGGIERARRKLENRKDGLQILASDTTTQINEASLALYVDPPAEALAQRNLSLESVRHYGILWDAEKERWITPVRDPDTGRIWGWQEKNARFFRNFPKDLRKSKTLFGIHQFPVGQPGVLVESPLDVPRLFTAGVVGGLSSYGAGVSNEQMELIIDVTDELIVALDNDRDGERYSKAIKDVYAGRLLLKFIDYRDLEIKDVGEATDEQIHTCLDGAISSALVRF